MKNNKGDMRLQFEANKFFRQVAPTSKKQLKKKIQVQISPLRPKGPEGLSKKEKLFSEFEFDIFVP